MSVVNVACFYIWIKITYQSDMDSTNCGIPNDEAKPLPSHWLWWLTKPGFSLLVYYLRCRNSRSVLYVESMLLHPHCQLSLQTPLWFTWLYIALTLDEKHWCCNCVELVATVGIGCFSSHWTKFCMFAVWNLVWHRHDLWSRTICTWTVHPCISPLKPVSILATGDVDDSSFLVKHPCLVC